MWQAQGYQTPVVGSGLGIKQPLKLVPGSDSKVGVCGINAGRQIRCKTVHAGAHGVIANAGAGTLDRESNGVELELDQAEGRNVNLKVSGQVQAAGEL